MQQTARIANITPVNDRAVLADIAAQIVELLKQRTELGEKIRVLYQDAADLGCPKRGFKLAIAHSRLSEENRDELVLGYRSGAEALGLQLDLFEESEESQESGA